MFKKGHKLRVGMKHPKSFIEKRKMEGNPYWKGDNVTMNGLHDWIRRNFKMPKKCEICKNIKRKLEWSNKRHIISRKIEDWQYVCRSCHMLYDYKYNNRPTNAAGKITTWSRKHLKCINCGKVEIKHASKGLCRHCLYLKRGM